jgi:hypothetical protein
MTKPSAAALVIGVVLEFAVVAGILAALVPAPRSPLDYLVIGTLSTFVSLGTVFAVLTLTRKRTAVRKPPAGEID